MSSIKSYKISPASLSSIPALANISDLAFKTDTHTQLKELCKPSPRSQTGTSNHASSMASALKSWMSVPKGRIVVLQAVEEGSGEIAGWAAWAGKGIEVAWVDEVVATTTDEGITEEARSKDTKNETSKEENGNANAEDDQPKPSHEILALETLTNNTMAFWASHFSGPSPEPSPHLIFISIAIHPSHQGCGVGSSLINWGTSIADAHGVFCWVSSSDGGYRVFEKAGFREVGMLAVELDEFAVDVDGERVRNPDAKGEDGKWGMYTWRWMKRDAIGR